jgi:predicted lipoprotein with Yx(FWY)xxD motif
MEIGAVRRVPAIAAAFMALAVVACGGTGASSTPSASPSQAAATVQTASKSVGGKKESVLVGTKGLTLYYYTPDKAGSVTCTGQCLVNWPPLVLGSGVTTPTGARGVTGKLATVASPGGRTQVTYNGWPLYYFVKDKDGEDVYGQGVGGNWFVATPDLASAS